MIHKIIQQLEKTSSTNAKIEILKENSGNEVLKTFFDLALNPQIQFYIRKIPDYETDYSQSFIPLSLAIEKLEILSSRVKTGNAGIQHLTNLLSILAPDDAEMIQRIIKKDPKCGVSTETVNKIWEDLIPTYPVLLASPYSEKLEDSFDWDNGVFVQEKSDGARANIIIRDGQVQVFSRNGKEFHVQGRFDHLIEKFNNMVIDGELVAAQDGVVLNRQLSNGVANKCNKNTATKEETEMMSLYCWDIIPIEASDERTYDVPYEKRFKKLSSMVKDVDGLILIDSKIVYCKEEANSIYKKKVKEGKEGTLIKARDLLWEDKRSKKQMKAKEVIEVEMRVLGIEEGTASSKYAGMLGKVKIASEDGIINCSCGSGFNDYQRQYYWDNPEEILNKVITVEFNKLSENKVDKSISLFLPIFIEVRDDKEKANTYEEILAETKK